MNRSQLVFGLLFIAVGILLLAEQAGLVSAWPVIADWWPTIVLVSGVAQLVTRPRNVLGGAITIVVGVALLLITLGVIDTVALLWPLLLIGLGAWLLFGRPRTGPTELESATDVFAVFDDRVVRVPAGPFSGGAVTTVFGDVDLDLSATTLPNGRAILQVTTIFGDVDVTIPPGWDVTVSGPEILGDVRVPPRPAAPPSADGTPPPPPGLLQLRAVLILGDVEVRTAARSTAHDGSTRGS